MKTVSKQDYLNFHVDKNVKPRILTDGGNLDDSQELDNEIDDFDPEPLRRTKRKSILKSFVNKNLLLVRHKIVKYLSNREVALSNIAL